MFRKAIDLILLGQYSAGIFFKIITGMLSLRNLPKIKAINFYPVFLK